MRALPHLRSLPVAAVLALCAMPGAAFGAKAPLEEATSGVSSREIVPGEAIVRFSGGTSAAERLGVRRAADVSLERSLEVPRAQLVETEGTVAATVDRLERQPGVAFAQPNYRYRASQAPAHWQGYVENGGIPWGTSAVAASGTRSAADSPAGVYGRAVDSTEWAVSQIARAAPVSLVGRRGCRMHFAAMYEVEQPDSDGDFNDVFAAGAVSGAADDPVFGYAGESEGYPTSFDDEEISISSLDGRADAQPVFSLLSDASVEHDGAYVDDVRVFCRDSTYVDAISPASQYDEPNVGNYVRFNGTSMATPHVAGVAALVGAAVPAASDLDVVHSIKEGGTPLASLSTTTASGCTVDAAGAIAVATGAAAGDCGGHPPVAAAPAPNDTFFGQLWGLESSAAPNPGVSALEAWSTTRGDGQVIAVVDTGVDLTHPDIQGNLWTGAGGVHGHDFVDDDTDPDDFQFHGTHVAGTAAAIDGNGLGIAGVAPNAQIMAIRALDGDGSGTSSDIADGIAWAADNGADVVNLSLGGPAGAGDSLTSAAVDVANANDVVVVAAAGNDDNDNDASPTTPCTLAQPNLVCVAAVTQSGALAGFSNHGATSVDVGAPGTNILSAKTDYGVPLLADGFDDGAPPPVTPPVAPPSPTTPLPTYPIPTPSPAPTPRAPAPRPVKPDLAGSARKVRVSRRGAFKYAFRATPRLTGSALFRTRRKVRVPRRMHLTVARPRFGVRSSGTVTVRPRLSRKQLRLLRRNGRFLLTVTVTVRNGAGLSASARKRLTVLPPRP